MEKQKKRKNYFSNQRTEKKKKKHLTLECGMKGFLCTCNFREKDCVREAYTLLNEYVEKISESEENKLINNEKNEKEKLKIGELNTNCEKGKVKNKNISEDIFDILNVEINEMKAEAKKEPSEKKFQVVDTGVNNVIFIKTTIPDTLPLVTAIIEDLYELQKQRTRYLLRILPIQITCKAYINDIKLKANIVFEQYFSQEPKTYCIIVNRHSNSNLQRNEIIEALAEVILKKNPGNKANLKNPEIAVIVEIVRAICLISIAPKYFTYKKYNLVEICNKKK